MRVVFSLGMVLVDVLLFGIRELCWLRVRRERKKERKKGGGDLREEESRGKCGGW